MNKWIKIIALIGMSLFVMIIAYLQVGYFTELIEGLDIRGIIFYGLIEMFILFKFCEFMSFIGKEIRKIEDKK